MELLVDRSFQVFVQRGTGVFGPEVVLNLVQSAVFGFGQVEIQVDGTGESERAEQQKRAFGAQILEHGRGAFDDDEEGRERDGRGDAAAQPFEPRREQLPGHGPRQGQKAHGYEADVRNQKHQLGVGGGFEGVVRETQHGCQDQKGDDCAGAAEHRQGPAVHLLREHRGQHGVGNAHRVQNQHAVVAVDPPAEGVLHDGYGVEGDGVDPGQLRGGEVDADDDQRHVELAQSEALRVVPEFERSQLPLLLVLEHDEHLLARGGGRPPAPEERALGLLQAHPARQPDRRLGHEQHHREGERWHGADGEAGQLPRQVRAEDVHDQHADGQAGREQGEQEAAELRRGRLGHEHHGGRRGQPGAQADQEAGRQQQRVRLREAQQQPAGQQDRARVDVQGAPAPTLHQHAADHAPERHGQHADRRCNRPETRNSEQSFRLGTWNLELGTVRRTEKPKNLTHRSTTLRPPLA